MLSSGTTPTNGCLRDDEMDKFDLNGDMTGFHTRSPCMSKANSFNHTWTQLNPMANLQLYYYRGQKKIKKIRYETYHSTPVKETIIYLVNT
jgi:hypothetical protein